MNVTSLYTNIPNMEGLVSIARSLIKQQPNWNTKHPLSFLNLFCTRKIVKETATHSYLHYTSCHPKNCTRKGPYGQFLRIKRNCTKDADFEKRAEDMKKHYAERGYPNEIIQDSYNKAKSREHHALYPAWYTANQTKKMAIKGSPALVLTYHPLNPNLIKIIKKHWQILHLLPNCKDLSPEPPILAYRRNRKRWQSLRWQFKGSPALVLTYFQKTHSTPKRVWLKSSRNWRSPGSHVPPGTFHAKIFSLIKGSTTRATPRRKHKESDGFTLSSPSNQKKSTYGNDSKIHDFPKNSPHRNKPTFRPWNLAICTLNENSLVLLVAIIWTNDG